MKLTAQQIRPLLFGAAHVTEDGGIFSPGRFSQKTLDAWGALNEGLLRNAEATAGIRLDFETDAAEVRFAVKGKFECLVDGLLSACTEPSQTPSELSLSLDGTGHRITLLFPSHSPAGTLYGVEINDGAAIAPHKYGERFLFLGDSITQGWNSGTDCLSYAWRTSLFFNADCRILGVGGAFFHPSVFESPEAFSPHRVFVAFGTNDFGYVKTLDDLKIHAAAYLDRVTEAYGGKKICGITPIWRYDTWDKSMGTFDECIAVLREEYEARGIPVIDGMTLVPHEKAFFADAVHPNALGFSCYSQNLIRMILNDER